MASNTLADELLFWALEASDGDTTRLMGPDGWRPGKDLPGRAVQQAVSLLITQGWACAGRRNRKANGDVFVFTLTASGVREAQRRKQAVASRRERLVYAEEAILRWVFEAAPPGQPVQLLDFLESPQVIFYGTKLTVDEITAASSSLVGLKMLSTTGGPLTGVWLEAEGSSCVMSGLPVRTYLREKTAHFEQHVHQGGAGAQGYNVNQHPGTVA